MYNIYKYKTNKNMKQIKHKKQVQLCWLVILYITIDHDNLRLRKWKKKEIVLLQI